MLELAKDWWCVTCIRAKQHCRKQLKWVDMCSTCLLKLIHTDLCGLINGSYILTFINQCSKYTSQEGVFAHGLLMGLKLFPALQISMTLDNSQLHDDFAQAHIPMHIHGIVIGLVLREDIHRPQRLNLHSARSDHDYLICCTVRSLKRKLFVTRIIAVYTQGLLLSRMAEKTVSFSPFGHQLWSDWYEDCSGAESFIWD